MEDADVMWFRDPLPHFYPDGDFQIACDHFVGNSSDLRSILNGGFYYVKSSQRTVEFYKFWFSSREDYPGYHDQDVLNFIKHDQFIRDMGLSMRFLDTAYFGGICEPSKDLNKMWVLGFILRTKLKNSDQSVHTGNYDLFAAERKYWLKGKRYCTYQLALLSANLHSFRAMFGFQLKIPICSFLHEKGFISDNQVQKPSWFAQALT
ncbi:hypothetical protein Taro_035676 [Colocasia esculenta]|uniref:Nucleotide-diphospho-sugar transferase domain-containing protein n=1 Tax=Colocasia esculenta TaxID=4460 RepID=A0A843W129_COLES|nr:hypothetical protein [Colocasia esculenta]